MYVLGNEQGFVVNTLLIVFAVLFILASMIFLVAHNPWVALIAFLIGVFLYPAGTKLKGMFAK